MEVYMNYLNFDETRDFDLVLFRRVAIDFNSAVSEDFQSLKNVSIFEKYV